MAITISGTSGLLFEDGILNSYGDDNDLQINHDGSNSYINDAGTGNLRLQTGGSTKLEVTSTGIDVTGKITTDTLTEDTTGLGINTAPDRDFHVKGKSGDPVHVKLEGDPADYARIMFDDGTTENIGEIRYHFGDDDMRFTTNNAERMRIDSSGNLLVGKTGSGLNSAGIEIRGSDDSLRVIRSDGNPVYLNRQTSDGNIIDFAKDGTTVGSIGSSGGTHLIAGSNDVGFRFDSLGDAIQPWNISTNANRTASIDLGKATSTYKDLYLSGGVYVGGTGSANYLDDYEEGTFTPTIYGQTTAGTPTIGLIEGTYTKIGRLVHFQINLYITAFSGATGELRVGGLPFTNIAGANSRNYNPVSTNCNHSSYNSYNNYIDTADWYIQPNSTYIRSNNIDSSGDSAFEIRLAGTYTST